MQYHQSEFYDKAIVLFERLAARHQLIYNIEVEPEVDILWTFPAQTKLALPITLCLQGDELNFGVERFWSYYFPYEKVAQHFETTINNWVNGDARLAIFGKNGRLLQVCEETNWKTVYSCGGLFMRWRRPNGYLNNRTLGAADFL